MHTLYILWFGYFKPSLYGNGPEALVQTIAYAAVAMAVWPPARRWATRETAHLHAKMDHIIKHHPDIPVFTHPVFAPAEDVHDAVAHDPTAVPFPPVVPTDGTVSS